MYYTYIMDLREGEKILKTYRHHPTPFVWTMIKTLLIASLSYVFLYFSLPFLSFSWVVISHIIFFSILVLIIIYLSLIYWLDALIITNQRVISIDYKFLTDSYGSQSFIADIEDGRPTGTLLNDAEIFGMRVTPHGCFVKKEGKLAVEILEPALEVVINDKKINSFEPIPSVFEELKRNSSADPGWDVYNLALGNRDGKEKINLPDNFLFSSFLSSNKYCEERFGRESVGVKQESVTIRRLEGLFNEIKIDLRTARIYLKMDTQGYDMEVFSGLGVKNKYISVLQSELSVTPIYKGMPHLTESISFFEAAGFELAGLYPVNRDQSTLRVIEYDCLMVNGLLPISDQSG